MQYHVIIVISNIWWLFKSETSSVCECVDVPFKKRFYCG